MKKCFPIKKVGGSIAKKDDLIQWLESRLSFLPNGSYEVKVDAETKGRTANQLRVMWMWLRCLSHEIGHTPEDFHAHYCRKYLKRPDPLDDGEIVVGSTSGLSTESMTDFLLLIQADASIEYGIMLPTPDDLRWGEFELEYKK